MADVDNILAGFPTDFHPSTGEDSRKARERGWWIGNVQQADEDKVRFVFVLRDATTHVINVKSSEISPTTIARIGEALLTDFVTLRRHRGRKPLH